MDNFTKNSFVMYTNYFEILQDLNNEEAGILFKSILQYQATDEICEMPSNVRIAFKFIKNQLDIDKRKYNDFCEKQRKNGARGGAPVGNKNAQKNNPNNPTVKKTTQTTLNENDNENDNDSSPLLSPQGGKVCEENFEKIQKKIDPFTNPMIDKCFNVYRDTCVNLPRLRFEPRNAQIREQLNDFLIEIDADIGYFRKLCEKANALRQICNKKIDFKMLIKNHIGIFNGKFERQLTKEERKALFDKCFDKIERGKDSE